VTEHAERIAKMKELYGLFVKMEEEVKPMEIEMQQTNYIDSGAPHRM
jgi:hypothetical protein